MKEITEYKQNIAKAADNYNYIMNSNSLFGYRDSRALGKTG